jgi:hypothetical protein
MTKPASHLNRIVEKNIADICILKKFRRDVSWASHIVNDYC